MRHLPRFYVLRIYRGGEWSALWVKRASEAILGTTLALILILLMYLAHTALVRQAHRQVYEDMSRKCERIQRMK